MNSSQSKLNHPRYKGGKAYRIHLFRITLAALLSAMSFVLMLLNFPLLPMAPYLKMDFSEVPALLGGVLLGPFVGIIVEFIKNLLELIIRGAGSTLGFGNIQNFLVGIAYVVPYSIIFRRMSRSEKRPIWMRALIASVAGVVIMVVVAFLSNLVVAPLYFKYFMEKELSSGEAITAAGIASLFTAIKSVIISVVMTPVIAMGLKPLKSIVDKIR